MAICPRCKTSGPLAEACPNDRYHFVEEEELAKSSSAHLLGVAVADKYVPLSIIGEGGMGMIYSAKQKMVGREVALKVLKKIFMEEENIRDRFVREAEVVAKLNHRSIVTLYDAGIDQRLGVMYMAMELLRGETLYHRLKSQTIDFSQTLTNFISMASALAEAHRQGIVHRDLKPENVFLVRDENDVEIPKILDFGFARLQGASKKLTMAGVAFGTPHYMSPEQATGSETITPAADIYAMGVMLFEAVTGRVPFDGKTPMEVMQQQVYSPTPQWIPREGLIVSQRLVDCVNKCLNKEPSQRFASGAELQSELLAIQSEGVDKKAKLIARKESTVKDVAAVKKANFIYSTKFLSLVLIFLFILLGFVIWISFF